MKIEDLRKMSEAELFNKHDEAMKTRAEHYNIYLDELARREAMRQGERMEALTASINRLTWFIAGATLVGVILTLVSLSY
jgi:hypothetical protein